MEIENIPFQIFDLENTAAEEYAGETGKAFWRTVKQGNVRMRIVEYSPGYLADHWCRKGHAIFVLEGEFDSEIEDGRVFTLRKGMGYLTSDDRDAHRSRTKNGVKLLIVD